MISRGDLRKGTKMGFSFEIRTPEDFLRKLQEEYQDFFNDPTSSRHAINCAMTAWHLTDWIWATNKQRIQTNIVTVDGIDDLQRFVIAECPELEVIQCITNGSKHVRQGRSRVQSTHLRGGAFDRGFSRGFDIGGLEVVLDDGSAVWFEDIIKAVADYWERFFNKYLRGDQVSNPQ
jgi:hypothetical protein